MSCQAATSLAARGIKTSCKSIKSKHGSKLGVGVEDGFNFCLAIDQFVFMDAKICSKVVRWKNGMDKDVYAGLVQLLTETKSLSVKVLKSLVGYLGVFVVTYP